MNYAICCFIVFHEESIDVSDLPDYILNPEESVSLKMEDIEKVHVEKILKLKNSNLRQTALTIGWAHNTLKNKMKKYGIDYEKQAKT